MSIHDQVEAIYAAERENIFRYLRYFNVPAPRAQELAQDCFVKLYLKLSQGDRIEEPRAWLYRVAQNQARRYHRREPVFDEIDETWDAPVPQPDPELDLMARQQQALLARAVSDLSPQQRNCLHLRGQGLRYREIAEAMGISTSAVGEFLRRAVTKLKGVLDG
jgi:RNA polymerase sigma-70 factor (ECF subfamily)